MDKETLKNTCITLQSALYLWIAWHLKEIWHLQLHIEMTKFGKVNTELVSGRSKSHGKKLHSMNTLTHWARVTHVCVSKLNIIGSDKGLSPDRRQAIIWTNAGSLLVRTLGTNFNEILIEILTFSFKKMRLKVSFANRRPFCLGLNVLNTMWAGLYQN